MQIPSAYGTGRVSYERKQRFARNRSKQHAPTIQDLYLLPNQGAEAVVSGS